MIDSFAKGAVEITAQELNVRFVNLCLETWYSQTETYVVSSDKQPFLFVYASHRESRCNRVKGQCNDKSDTMIEHKCIFPCETLFALVCGHWHISIAV